MRTAHSLLRLVSILLDLAQDALQFLLLGTRSSAASKRKIFSSVNSWPSTWSLRLSRDGRPSHSTIYGSALAAFCIAECLDQRQARDLPRLASEGFSVALAMEVETAREAPRAQATSGTDLQDGPPEPNVGRGAHRCRVASQTRNSSIPANGEALYAH
jgi:hypothetical protein